MKLYLSISPLFPSSIHYLHNAVSPFFIEQVILKLSPSALASNKDMTPDPTGYRWVTIKVRNTFCTISQRLFVKRF